MTPRTLLLALLLPSLAIASTTSLARADGHEDWQLLVGSVPNEREGTCAADLVVIAAGFEGTDEVAIGRIDDGAFVELIRVTTPANGLVRLEDAAVVPPDCVDGDSLTFAARGVADGAYLGPAGGLPYQVIFESGTLDKPGSIALVPSSGLDCAPGSITVVGEGFPPDVGVTIAIGEAFAFADEFAEIARGTSDSTGHFSVVLDFLLGRTCSEGDQFAIHALVRAGAKGAPSTDFPRASAIFTVGPPTPSSAGDGALVAPRTSRGVATLLAVTALLLLPAARTLTAARAPRR
jgi:hypothetical protein